MLLIQKITGVHLFHLFSLSSFLSTSVWDQARRPRGIGRVFNRQEKGNVWKTDVYILYYHFEIQVMPTNRVAVKVLLGVLVVELQLDRLRMETTGYVWLLFTNVPRGHVASDL